MLAMASTPCCGGQKGASRFPAKNCSGGVLLLEEEIVRFQGCTEVHGDLQVGGAITDLDALSKVAVVHGALAIGPSYQLRSTTGLAGLIRVEGALRVQQNWVLQGIYLGALQSVVGEVRISGNSSLTVASLHRLTKVVGPVVVDGNSRLQRLDLSLLSHAPSGVRVSGVKKPDVIAPEKNDWQKAALKPALPSALY